MEPVTTPPGWYHDGYSMRWWNGVEWGPYAPVLPIDPVEQGKTLAVIAQFGMFACWFVLPLVIRLTGGKDNEYVRHHSTEALNFMITSGILYAIGLAGYLVAFLSSFGGGTPGTWFAFFPVLWLLQIAVLAFSIMAAVRASQGVWWRYPISIRFVPGARPRVDGRT